MLKQYFHFDLELNVHFQIRLLTYIGVTYYLYPFFLNYVLWQQHQMIEFWVRFGKVFLVSLSIERKFDEEIWEKMMFLDIVLCCKLSNCASKVWHLMKSLQNFWNNVSCLLEPSDKLQYWSHYLKKVINKATEK